MPTPCYLTVFGNIAGMGALLAILIYMLATLALPFYVHHRGESLRVWRHILIPAAGVGIWIVPLWGSLKPGQVFPANTYPVIALGVAAAAATYAILRRRIGSRRPPPPPTAGRAPADGAIEDAPPHVSDAAAPPTVIAPPARPSAHAADPKEVGA